MRLLQSIALHDFRSYEKLSLSLPPGLNLLLGANGQGKTNLLEAIYFLSLLRSFRTTQLRNLVRWRRPEFILRGEVSDQGASHALAVQLGDKRQLRLAGKTIHRASDFINSFFTGVFVPEDIALVKGSASDRRRFLDIALAQAHAYYLLQLQDYHRALKHRNLLLRRELVPGRELQAFDGLLAEKGAALTHQRSVFFAELAPLVERLGAAYFPEGRSLKLRYDPSLSGPLDDVNALQIAFAQALYDNFERDRQRQQTTVGPHRDDFRFLLDDRDLGRFGSEGQCRLAALLLRMAGAELLRERHPVHGVVLLVDDVIGELDARARTAFFTSLREAPQVFVAATEATVLGELQPTAIWDVRPGEVHRREH